MNKLGHDNLPSLHVACTCDNPKVLLLLLDCGAKLSTDDGTFPDDLENIKLSEECNAIVKQAKQKRLNELLKIAKENQTVPNLRVGDLKLRNSDGTSLLMMPEVLANTVFMKEACRVIMEKFQDSAKRRYVIVNARRPSDGSTALIEASKFGKVDCIRRLIKVGADPALADKTDW